MTVLESLENLKALQGLDEGIRALEGELEQLPKALEAAREDLAAVERKHADATKVLEEAVKRRRDLEQEIAQADSNVVKFENDKIRVKTNEEFRALNHQIELQNQKKSALEDQVLLNYDHEETAGERVRKLKDEVAMVAKMVAAREQELNTRADEDRGRLEELRSRRETVTGACEPAVLSRYNAIAQRKGGQAVALVVRGSCGGCHTQQPPQKVNEIRKQDRIYNCDFCGRFLLWNDGENGAS